MLVTTPILVPDSVPVTVPATKSNLRVSVEANPFSAKQYVTVRFGRAAGVGVAVGGIRVAVLVGVSEGTTGPACPPC